MTGTTDRAAILGIGRAAFEKKSQRMIETLALDSIIAALDDAELEIGDIDGVLTFGLGDTISAAGIATLTGMPNVGFISTLDGGGNVVVSAVGYAAAAVQSGLAKKVLVVRALKARTGKRLGGTDEPEHLSTAGIRQFTGPYGWTAYSHTFALVARRYMIENGISDTLMYDGMKAVAQTARRYSSRNPRALMRDLISDDDYASSPMIADPFRRLDCCLESDGACALIVGMPSARDRGAVEITAFREGGGPMPGGDLLAFLEWDNWSKVYAHFVAQDLYAQAGLGPTDMDLAILYDNFTTNVISQLEGFGFCGPGEAIDFVVDGNIGPGGSLPVNTHGGLLAEAYNHGLNGVLEAYDQLRDRGAGVQLSEPVHALVASGGVGVGSAMILSR